MNKEPEHIRPAPEASKPNPPTGGQAEADIFARLKNRGIDFQDVHRITQSERPHDTLFLAQWFQGRTISQVLEHLDKRRAFLNKDFILPLSGELKGQVERFTFGTELLVWARSLRQTVKWGPWDLRVGFLPTGRAENGQAVYIHPDREIVAIHRDTRETRRARPPGGPSRATRDAS